MTWGDRRETPLLPTIISGAPCRISLSRRRHAVGALAKVDLIQIHLQNLIFRQHQLHLVGQNQFTKLAVKGPFRGKKQRTCELLGDGARPFDSPSAMANICPGRPNNPHDIQARMFEKPRGSSVAMTACVRFLGISGRFEKPPSMKNWPITWRSSEYTRVTRLG